MTHTVHTAIRAPPRGSGPWSSKCQRRGANSSSAANTTPSASSNASTTTTTTSTPAPSTCRRDAVAAVAASAPTATRGHNAPPLVYGAALACV
eukprot:scaffold309087_cov12-Tisochrysis_lutea.AAC.1